MVVVEAVEVAAAMAVEEVVAEEDLVEAAAVDQPEMGIGLVI